MIRSHSKDGEGSVVVRGQYFGQALTPTQKLSLALMGKILMQK